MKSQYMILVSSKATKSKLRILVIFDGETAVVFVKDSGRDFPGYDYKLYKVQEATNGS